MVPGEVLRPVSISGWCGNPSITDDVSSHSRCDGGNRANPAKEFAPCKCFCHYPEDEYECECGGIIKEAPLWPLDEDGDVRYTHIDPVTGMALGEDCMPRPRVSRNREKMIVDLDPEPVKYEPVDPIEAGETGDEDFDALLAELDADLD